ncbi:MAG: NUDIX hydrolase [Pseudomonadales bacterium]
MNPANAHLTVATVIEHEGRFLMVREMDQGLEVINQPAGHWEPGESLPQAAIRETLEETAWHIELTGLIGVFLSSNPHGDHYCRIAFAAKALSHDGELALDEDILAAQWMSLDELQAQRDKMRSKVVLQTLQAWLDGQHFDLSAVSSIPMVHSKP